MYQANLTCMCTTFVFNNLLMTQGITATFGLCMVINQRNVRVLTLNFIVLYMTGKITLKILDTYMMYAVTNVKLFHSYLQVFK